MNKLQAMEVFVQVVDAGGFTKAADNMKLPKATVSTLVQGLEQALAIKLLHRTTRQISVTTDGAAYYERCVRILSDVKEAEEALSHNRVNPGGRLRVDVSTGLANNMIIPALSAFFERYPDIQLEMGCSDRPVDLIEEGVDVAIRGGTLPDSGLIARRLGFIDFVTCASPAYLKKFGRPSHPNELAQHRCINYFSPKTGKVMDWDFMRDGETIALAAPANLAVNDSTAYTSAGIAGLGILMMPNYMTGKLIDSGLLERVLPEWTTSPLPIHAVYPQNRHLSAKVRVFVEWVADLFVSRTDLQLKSTTT